MGHKDVEPSNHYCFSKWKMANDLKGSYSWRYTRFDHVHDYGREGVLNRESGRISVSFIPFDHLLAELNRKMWISRWKNWGFATDVP